MYCTALFVHPTAAAKRRSLQEHTVDHTCCISHLRVLYCLGMLYLCCSLWFNCPRLQAEYFASIFDWICKECLYGILLLKHTVPKLWLCVKEKQQFSFTAVHSFLIWEQYVTITWRHFTEFSIMSFSIVYLHLCLLAVHKFKDLFNMQSILTWGNEIIHTTICNVLKES